MTPLDLAHDAMNTAPDDDAARLKFFERVAESELFLLLEKEADGQDISPMVFPVDGTEYVLGFDLEERLGAFTGKPAPYAAMSGRVLARMLSGRNTGFGLNLDVAPSAILIPPDALAWLEKTLDQRPSEVAQTPTEFAPPSFLPEALITALDTKLSTAIGLAKFAYLSSVAYDNGTQSHLLAFVDPLAGSEPALADAVNEALIFSGIEAGFLDVAFFSATDPICLKLARVGLRFDLPQHTDADTTTRPAPGSDPAKPPVLR